tara:strand:+ start:59 stop:652 length:594 start_codon:yes stop_codon:yes gene_type:complete
MDNIFTVFNTFIAGAIAILIIILKFYLNNKKCYDPVAAQNTIDENVMAAIEYIREELDADRVIIQEFHNGGKYFSGSSQQKLSITYEFCRKGISSVFRRFQNVRVSALSNILKHSISDQITVNLDTEKCAYSYDLQTHGTSTAVFTILKTLTNKNIGLLSIHYVNRDNIKLTDYQQKLVDRQRKIISGYLLSHKIKI